jgi:hypothetical protein
MWPELMVVGGGFLKAGNSRRAATTRKYPAAFWVFIRPSPYQTLFRCRVMVETFLLLFRPCFKGDDGKGKRREVG